MKIQIETEEKYKTIYVHEFDHTNENDVNELNKIINSFYCFYPWYISDHKNKSTKVIYNVGGLLTESDKIKIFDRWDFKL